ncbi:MAG: acyl carrier protein [Pseudanabaenaceae cyanobacterium]
MSATLTKVQEIIADKLGKKLEEVRPEAHLQNDLGADSLDTVELVMSLEEAFELEIPDEDAQGIQTVQDVVNYIDSKKSAA